MKTPKIENTPAWQTGYSRGLKLYKDTPAHQCNAEAMFFLMILLAKQQARDEEDAYRIGFIEAMWRLL